MKKNILASLLSFTLFFALGATIVYGQATGGNPGSSGGGNPGTTNASFKLTNPFEGGDNLVDLLKALVNDIIIPIGAVLAVLAFIYAGFLYVTSGGDTTQLKKAHNALLNAAIGTAVLMGAWTISEVLRATIDKVTN